MHLGALVALWIGMRHVEGHLLGAIVPRVGGAGTLGVDANRGCVKWSMLLY